MITNKVVGEVVIAISDGAPDMNVNDHICDKISSGEYIVLTLKEYEGMLKAIQNFQRKK
jgi:hypothetical protein